MESKSRQAVITFSKTFTPVVWFEFQKQNAVVEVIDIETVLKIPGYKEIRVTFTWDASKTNEGS